MFFIISGLIGIMLVLVGQKALRIEVATGLAELGLGIGPLLLGMNRGERGGSG